MGKWDEVPHVDALMTLYRNPNIQKYKLGGHILMPYIEQKEEKKRELYVAGRMKKKIYRFGFHLLHLLTIQKPIRKKIRIMKE